MRYLPHGPAPDDVRYAMIGGWAAPGSALHLSNYPGVAVPAAWRGDTLAQIALQVAGADRDGVLLSGIEAISAAEFSVDALLALWVLCDPRGALARAEKVEEAALAGAFGVRGADGSAEFGCWARGYREALGLHDDAAAYAALLPLVPSVLDTPREHDLYWIGEMSDIVVSGAMLNSGAVELDEHPALDLTVIQTPLDLHDITRFSAARGTRLLTIRSENTHVLEYRRESWVQLASRRPPPRLDLRPLAARLNLFERSDAAWVAESLDQPLARLYLDAGRGRPAPSTIDAETVIAEALEYLSAAAQKPELSWSPYPIAHGDA